MINPDGVICVGCNRIPSEIQEYIDMAAESSMTPAAFVIAEEGTLNQGNGHFLCTECYIKWGQPTAPAPQRWVAP